MALNTLCNGYDNYETFCIHMDIHKNPEKLRDWVDIARDTLDSQEPERHLSRRELGNTALATRLQCHYLAVAQDQGKECKGVLWQLLSGALSLVNWMQLAKKLTEAAEERL